MKFNTTKKHETAIQEAFDDDKKYVTVEVGAWGQVEVTANMAAERGYRVHTVRDGIGAGFDVGYRILFERMESWSIG